MRKSLSEHLDKIEKQTIEEMLLAEQKLQGKLKNVRSLSICAMAVDDLAFSVTS
jgi:hypothetical protein